MPRHWLFCLAAVLAESKPLASRKANRHRSASCLLQAGVAAPPLQSKIASGPFVSELQQSGNRTVQGTVLQPHLNSNGSAGSKKADMESNPALMPENMYDKDFPSDSSAYLGNFKLGPDGEIQNGQKEKAEATAGIKGNKGGKKPLHRTEGGSHAGAATGREASAKQAKAVSEAVSKERQQQAKANLARLTSNLKSKSAMVAEADKKAHKTNLKQEVAYNKLMESMNHSSMREEVLQSYISESNIIAGRMDVLKNISLEAKKAYAKAQSGYKRERIQLKRKRVAAAIAKKSLQNSTLEEVKAKSSFMVAKAEADAAVSVLRHAQLSQQAAEEELRQAGGASIMPSGAAAMVKGLGGQGQHSHSERIGKFIVVLLASSAAACHSSLL